MPRNHLTLAHVLLSVALGACSNDPATTPTSAAEGALAGANVPGAAVHRQYGTPVKVGNGMARAYVVLDETSGRVPLEIGMALDERALDGLPAPSGHGEHTMENEFLLPLPSQNPTPFRLLALNWNPAGHEPPGIYDTPHFDFHFNTITLEERNGIDPMDPEFQAKAERFPADGYIPEGWRHLPGPPAPALAIPMMGVHFMQLASPELQPPGTPGHAPFTKTYIWGSWDGKVIFQEPMITRAYLLSKPDVVVPITTAATYSPAGYYPRAYSVKWDAQAKEYRVALTQLQWMK